MCDKELSEAKLAELRLEYAWNFFEFHAKQRTTMFNYFLIAVGIFANAAVLAIRFTDYWIVPAVLLFTAAFLCFAFRYLDCRNVQLTEVGEDVLDKMEEETIFKDFGNHKEFSKVPLALIHRETREVERMNELPQEQGDTSKERKYLKPRVGRGYKHATWIFRIQYVCLVLFVAGGAGCLAKAAVSYWDFNKGDTTVSTAKGEIEINLSEEKALKVIRLNSETKDGASRSELTISPLEDKEN